MRIGWTLALAALVTGGALAPAATAAQDVEALAAECASRGVVTTLRCTELATAARALQGLVGVAAGHGSEVAGSSSTLGRRLVGSPRLSASIRSGVVVAVLPSLVDRENEPYPRSSFLVSSVDGAVVAGVFDGLSLMPTVGGFLSLDLFARGTALFLPRSEGFRGSRRTFSFGARVGLLRESFTLPGVSLSASRRVVGNVGLGSVALGDPGQVDVEPVVTSLRLTVGKDLYAAGVLAGVGWDRYGGSATVRMSDGFTSASATRDDFTSERLLAFGGISMTFLILQVSGEGGWASGFDPVDGYRGAPFDPTRGNAFGSLAFRLTL